MTLLASLSLDPVSVARGLLGSRLAADDGQGGVVEARIVEVEAYGSDPSGLWPDPAAHSYPGPTSRSRIMFGRAGHLYVYRSMGLHFCANVVAGPEGCGSGVLIRAGEIVAGHEIVRDRRPGVSDQARWARGPGNFGQSLGVTLADYGLDLLDPLSPVRLEPGDRPPDSLVASGPRVGISKAVDRPWRFWISDSKAVSAFRQGGRKKRVALFEKIEQ